MSDFIFYGNNFTSNGFQGLGSMLDNEEFGLFAVVSGAARTTQGCTSKTSICNKGKRLGTNAIDYDFGVIAMARDQITSLLLKVKKVGLKTKVRANGYLSKLRIGLVIQLIREQTLCIDILGESEIWMCGENGVVITTRNRNE